MNAIYRWWKQPMFVLLVCVNTCLVQAQQPPGKLQENLQQMQQANARNEQQLHTYQWIETVAVTINGNSKPPRQSICSYTADGTLNRSPLGSPPKMSEPRGPLRRFLTDKKMEAVQNELAQVRALVGLYLPPDHEKFRQAFAANKVSFEANSAGSISIVTHDYVKPGDELRLVLNVSTMLIQHISVKSYFENPKDILTADVSFSSLADGTFYPSETIVDAPLKKLSLTTVSSDFSKPATPASGELNAPSAHVVEGTLMGVTVDGVSSFQGVPFAAPPVGALRWRAPEPAPAWQGVRSAIIGGPPCVQPLPLKLAGAGGNVVIGQEDCLTLNVWTTAKPGEKQPVMVWIHGGAFRVGSASNPNLAGTEFAKQGITVVSINYRMGHFGIFAPPALTQDTGHGPIGNFSLMDQVAALRWVKNNITSFGGNPEDVTVVGQSAGGQSILFLLATPSAKGLFQKAIVESGSYRSAWKTPISFQQQGRNDEAYIEKTFGRAMTAAELRQVPANKLVSARDEGFFPFEDGTVLPQSPLEALRQGQAMRVPLIIGSVDDEVKTLLPLGSSIPAKVFAGAGANARALYAADGTSDDERARKMFTDEEFAASSRLIAREMARYAPTWLYYFSYVPKLRRQPGVGVGHAEELPFVFDSPDMVGSEGMTPTDVSEARLVNRCWGSFVKTGTPSDCGMEWPQYNATSDELLHFGNQLTVETDWRKAQLDFDDALTTRLWDFAP